MQNPPRQSMLSGRSIHVWSVLKNTSQSPPLTKLCEGKGLAGRPAYDPALLLRSLLISYLYNFSDRACHSSSKSHTLSTSTRGNCGYMGRLKIRGINSSVAGR
mgnify:FL=1